MIGAITAGLFAGGAVALPNSYESIATVTVGSGGTGSISFSSIPSTFKHLQIRSMTIYDSADRSGLIRFNSDSGSNYSWHWILGNGSAASATSTAPATHGLLGIGAASSANAPGASVLDILDYTDTNKYTTIKDLCGTDANGNGYASFRSSSWRNTAAVTSITIAPTTGNWSQYSSFALYGIKG